MRPNQSIQLKAAFLLMVFALNTVMAFACSMGLNMGYNEEHHGNEEMVADAHSHGDSPGTKPDHHNTTPAHSHDGSHKHSIAVNASHDHDNTLASHHAGTEKSESEDCCKDSAVKFQTEDKKLQKSQNIVIKAPVFVAFLSAFLGFDVAPGKTMAGIIFLIPEFYPPPDIRIAIQSFLI